MRFKTIGRAAIALTVAAATAIMVAPGAYAINRTRCNNRTDFFSIFNNTGEPCFANNGNANVAIFRVDAVSSGNNSGTYTIDGVSLFIPDFTVDFWDGTPEITDINITGR